MPNIFTIFGYHYYFYSNEGEPLEPVHIHVSKNRSSHGTKFWINSDGSCELESNDDNIPAKDLRKIENTIENYAEEIIKEWERFFDKEASYHDLEKNLADDFGDR